MTASVLALVIALSPNERRVVDDPLACGRRAHGLGRRLRDDGWVERSGGLAFIMR